MDKVINMISRLILDVTAVMDKPSERLTLNEKQPSSKLRYKIVIDKNKP